MNSTSRSSLKCFSSKNRTSRNARSLKIRRDRVPEVRVKAARVIAHDRPWNVLRIGLQDELRLGKSGASTPPAPLSHTILHQHGLRDRSLLRSAVVELAGWPRSWISGLVVLNGLKSVVGSPSAPAARNFRLMNRWLPGAAPDEILAQRHAQHASCHAIDREMDSRDDTVGRDAGRLAVELVDHRIWVSRSD